MGSVVGCGSDDGSKKSRGPRFEAGAGGTSTCSNGSQATASLHVDAKYVYFVAGATAGASNAVRVAK